MRTAYHEQLTDLSERLGEMCGLAGMAMERATQSLLQADLVLAEQVISGHEKIATLSARAEESAFVLLALQAPVAGDLRSIVSAIQMVADIDRMGALALHVAKIARRRHPQHALPEEVNGYFAEMGRVAVELGNSAQEVVLSRDPEKAARIREEDDAMDDLHRHLFSVLMDREWKHGVAAAVDVTLLGRFYERFADHAVEVARRVIFQATGSLPDDETAASVAVAGVSRTVRRCSPRWPSDSGWKRSSRCSSISTSRPGFRTDFQVEERRLVAHPRRLLHVVGDDDDGVLLLQLADQILDRHRRDRVQRRTRLVHQQHIGLHGDGPRDTQPLLLASGQAATGLVQPVLDLVPQVRAAQRMLGGVVEHPAIAHPLQPQAGDHVVANRHGGERVWPLEHHPDGPSHTHRVDAGGIDVLIVEQHGALDPGPGDHLMHPVQRAQHSRLAAARRADERSHTARQNRKRDIGDGLKRAVVDVDAVKVQPLGHLVLLPTTSRGKDSCSQPGHRS